MGGSRTEKALKNAGFSVLSQALTLILSFVSRTFFIKFFGVEYLGLNGLFTDVLGLLSMADLGFTIAMVYSFYEPLANHDERKLAGLITFYKRLYTYIAIAVALIGISLLPILPYIINYDTTIPNVNIYYLISLFNVVISYLWVYRTAILTADQQEYRIKKISMTTSIITTIVQIVVMYAFQNYTAYLLISTVFSLINNVIASWVASRLYPYIKNKVEITKQEKIEIFKNLGSVFVFKVSNVLINATDNILISILVGTVVVGYYSNYSMIQKQIMAFYSLLFTSMTASIGNLIVKESPESRYKVFKCQQSMSFVICIVIVPCFALLVNDFIGIWLGSSYNFDSLTLIIICLNMYLACVLQPLWTYREATGLYRKTKWIMLICAIENIILSIVLGKIMGLAGILLASALSRLSTYIWYEPQILFKEYFEVGAQNYYLSIVKNFVLIVVVFVVGSAMANKIIVDSIWRWIVKALIVGTFCVTFAMLAYWSSDGVVYIRKRIKESVKIFL